MAADYPLLFRSFLAQSDTVYFSYHVASEQVVYVSSAYAQALYDYDSPAGPMLGQDWQVTDLPRRFPKLTARYASAGIC